MQLTHPAKKALTELHKEFPNLHKTLDAIAFDSTRRSEWPANIFLPRELWMAVTAHELNIPPEKLSTPRYRNVVLNAVDRITMLGSWGKTQGIYRFDKDIYAELTSTPIDGQIPAKCLERLGEWCIYIETPDCDLIKSDNVKVHGAWVSLGYSLDEEKGEDPTHLLIAPHIVSKRPVFTPDGQDASKQIAIQKIALGNGLSIEEMLAQAHQNARIEMHKNNMHEMLQDLDALAEPQTKFIKSVISLCLYICTQNDLRNRKTGQTAPSTPVPQRLKKGTRLFQPDAPQEWDVGVRMGTAIRAALQAAASSGTGTGGSVRPHMRRAHWHSFRVGKIKNDAGEVIPAAMRDLVVKWIPSVPVNLPENLPAHELPAVIHKSN